MISPFAKKGFIDHTIYDSTAILKLIELRFGLECLGDRDKKSKDLTNAFDFDGPPPEPVCKPSSPARQELTALNVRIIGVGWGQS